MDGRLTDLQKVPAYTQERHPDITRTCSRILKEAITLSSRDGTNRYNRLFRRSGVRTCLRIGCSSSPSVHFYGKPLVPVNHALAHIELGTCLTGAKNPLVLLVSGGHTMILLYFNKRWRIFGETLTSPYRPLLDQFGRSLGFASPCGSMIERLANNSRKEYSWIPYTIKGK